MKILLLSFLFSFPVFGVVPDSTIDRLQKIYPDRTRQSLIEVIQNTKTTFELWRSFPAYFYEMIERKFSKQISLKNGFCTGDAHSENFGFLFSVESGKTLFTINDLDDSAPCKLEADLLRLLAGNLFLTDQTSEQVKYYLKGLSGEEPNFEVIKDLQLESVQKGQQLSKKFKKLYESNCSGDFSEVSEFEINFLKSYFEKTKRKFIKACSRIKESGGSAGLKRYVVFHEKSNGVFVVELKPIVTPAPLFGTSLSKEQRASIYQTAVEFFLGEGYLNSYHTLILNNELFLERPLVAGNIDIELKEFSGEKLKRLLELELHVLGLFHRKSKPSAESIDSAKLIQLAQEMNQLFKKEFGIP